ncbi:MAG: hypothetical protein QW292_11525 [Candidatus Parvarchaeota archaeon]
MNVSSVDDFIDEIQPDFAIVSGSSKGEFALPKSYSKAVEYTVPYGFYLKQLNLDAESIIKSVLAKKTRMVSISAKDAVSSAFGDFLREKGFNIQHLQELIGHLPTN